MTSAWAMRVRRHWTGFAGTLILGLFLLAGITAPVIVPQDPNEVDLTADLLGPSPENLLGTDHLGRDIFSRLLYGARSTLGLAIPIAVAVARMPVAIHQLDQIL